MHCSGLTVPTESYNVAFAKNTWVQNHLCQAVHYFVLQVLTDAQGCTHWSTHTAFPTWKPEEVFINPRPDFRGSMDLDFGIFSPLHSPVRNHSYITCCPSWFELGGWPSPWLATGKLCECLAPSHLFSADWAQHLKCHQATSQLVEHLGDTPRTKSTLQSVYWVILSSCSPLLLTKKKRTKRKSSRLGKAPLVKPERILQSPFPFKMSLCS